MFHHVNTIHHVTDRTVSCSLAHNTHCVVCKIHSKAKLHLAWLEAEGNIAITAL